MRSFLYFTSLMFFSVTLAGCQSTGGPSSGPIPAFGAGISQPGTFTRIKNPDPSKWQVTSIRGNTMRLLCRPLACPEPSALLLAHGRAPTREPDPAALQKLARQTIPTNIKAADFQTTTATDGYVRLKFQKSEVTKVRGFPAVVIDYQRTGFGRPDYAFRTIVFAGFSFIAVTSLSKSRAVARQNMDEAITAMDILDMPPPPPPKVGVSSPPADEAPAQEKK